MRDPHRTGQVNSSVLLAAASIVVASGLLWWLFAERSLKHASELHVYCAAGVLKAVEPGAASYEKEFGVKIRLDPASSGALLAKLQIAPKADLYIPADDSFIRLAHSKDLIREDLPLARFRLCLAVAKGNPKRIRSLSGLIESPDVTYSLPNDRAAAGVKAKEFLEPHGLHEAVVSGAKVRKPTVTEVAQDVQTGSVDAGFVWSSTAKHFGLDVVAIPELEDAWGTISAAVVSTSKQPTEALRFARYLAAPEKGQVNFEAHNYVAARGDAWAVKPTLLLYSGGVNRPAVEATLREFQAREGVSINTDYKGCGSLVAQMKSGTLPDVYFACDVSFSTEVADLFEEFRDVSRMRLVLIVPSGNPAGIRGFDDLARKGLKIGRAHEELSALGFLTKRLLEKAGTYEAVAANTRAISPTAAELVSQVVLGGHLDVAIVYEANAFSSVQRGEAEIIRINDPDAIAIQPIAARKDTKYPQLMHRLLESIYSQRSRTRFEKVGFQWLADGDKP